MRYRRVVCKEEFFLTAEARQRHQSVCLTVLDFATALGVTSDVNSDTPDRPSDSLQLKKQLKPKSPPTTQSNPVDSHPPPSLTPLLLLQSDPSTGRPPPTLPVPLTVPYTQRPIDRPLPPSPPPLCPH